MTNKTQGTYDFTKPYPVGGQPKAGNQDRSAYPVRVTPSEANAPDLTSTGANQPPRWSYLGPWASNEERLTQQALVVASIPGAELQKMVRPNLPQIRLFPDRFGYGMVNRVPTIDDVVSVDRVYPEPRVSWYSGGVGSYTGSSRNSLAAD